MKLREWVTQIRLVAEIGVNHEGSVAAAEKMVRMAAEAGADAVKFQVFNPAYEYVARDDAERFERIHRFALRKDDFHRLIALAEQKGLLAFATPLGLESLQWVVARCPIVKISSGDLTYEKLVRSAAATEKILFLSTGLSQEREIEQALSWIEEERSSDHRESVLLFHCVSAYPAPPEDLHLRTIPYLRQKYGVFVGYSDHTLGSAACLGAVALGAAVLEKHFTDCKTGRQFRDHALSLEPAEMKQLVVDARIVQQALGGSTKSVRDSEEKGREQMRRSIGASRNLAAGQILADSDLTLLRPASGLPPEDWNHIIGKKLVRPKRQAELIRAHDLE